MKYNIGIDLGGTNIKAGLINERRIVEKKIICPTKSENGRESVTIKLADIINELKKEHEISSVGIGIPGSVDENSGTVIYADNLGWEQYDLRKALIDKTGISVNLINDANAAALAESKFGASKNYKSSILITIGTGIGGGIIIDNKLITGVNGFASELGHMIIKKDGIECNCGNRGCFECYASCTGFIRIMKEKMCTCENSVLHRLKTENNNIIEPQLAFLGKMLNDKLSIEIIDEYVDYLAIGVSNLINMLFPEIIVFTGNIMEQGENLLAPLRKKIQEYEYAYSYSKKHTLIKKGLLGQDAGIIGATIVDNN